MTLNDQIIAWLTQQGIPNRDYQTGQPEGQAEEIISWGADLGPQPSVVQLQAAYTAQQLPTARAAQILVINAACQAALSAITAPYPPSEALTWDQQLAEAQAYTASSSATVPLLTAIAAASGETVAQLAASVLTANTAYKAASGAAIGKRQALTAQINAAATVAAVQAITW